ncbi:hypothetical protein CYMTET_25960, partial [Cymbomonas tetramitiformis]
MAPTRAPTMTPTISPSSPPTGTPTTAPTSTPTLTPTNYPTASPTRPPSLPPTDSPTAPPTAPPTAQPTSSRPPTSGPSQAPTSTAAPTASPPEAVYSAQSFEADTAPPYVMQTMYSTDGHMLGGALTWRAHSADEVVFTAQLAIRCGSGFWIECPSVGASTASMAQSSFGATLHFGDGGSTELSNLTVLSALPESWFVAEQEVVYAYASSSECSLEPVTEILIDKVAHSNLGGVGPDLDAPKEIRYSEVAQAQDSSWLDLVVVNTSTFSTTEGSSGKKNEFGRILVKYGSYVELTFSLVLSGTDTPAEPSTFYFSFSDLDTGNSGNNPEAVRAINFARYVLTDDTDLTATVLRSGETRFKAQSEGTTLDNPESPDNLTDYQQAHSVLLLYENTASFDIRLQVGGEKQDGQGGEGRNFFFAGANNMRDACAEDSDDVEPAWEAKVVGGELAGALVNYADVEAPQLVLRAAVDLGASGSSPERVNSAPVTSALPLMLSYNWDFLTGSDVTGNSGVPQRDPAFFVPAGDADWDALSYRFASDSSLMAGTGSLPRAQPPGASLNVSSGQITWDLTEADAASDHSVAVALFHVNVEISDGKAFTTVAFTLGLLQGMHSPAESADRATDAVTVDSLDVFPALEGQWKAAGVSGGASDPSRLYIRSSNSSRTDLVDAYLTFPVMRGFDPELATADLHLHQTNRKNGLNGGDLAWAVPTSSWSSSNVSYYAETGGGGANSSRFATWGGAEDAYHTVAVDGALRRWNVSGNTGLRLSIPQALNQGAIFERSGVTAPVLVVRPCGRNVTNAPPELPLLGAGGAGVQPQPQVVCPGGIWHGNATVVDESASMACDGVTADLVTSGAAHDASSYTLVGQDGADASWTIDWAPPSESSDISSPRVYVASVGPWDGLVDGDPAGLVFYVPATDDVTVVLALAPEDAVLNGSLGTLTVSAAFSQPVWSFDVADVTWTAASGGALTVFNLQQTHSAVYTFDVSPSMLDEYTVTLPAGTATSGCGENLESNTLILKYLTSTPTSMPTETPTGMPTASPTTPPTALPTAPPSSSPTAFPSDTPTATPSSGDVTVTVYVREAAQDQIRVSPAATSTAAELPYANLTVTIPASDWNQSVPVVVTAMDDELVEGDHSVTLLHALQSVDPEYGALPVGGLRGFIMDNDLAAVEVTAFEVLEGGNGSLSVALSGAVADGETVTAQLTSGSPEDITLPVQVLTFTGATASTPQSVLVAGTADDTVTGDRSVNVSVTLSSTVEPYNALPAMISSGSVLDQDVALVAMGSDLLGANDTLRHRRRRRLLRMNEESLTEGSNVTFMSGIVLSSQPTSLVTVRLLQVAMANATESLSMQQLSFRPGTLSFAPSDWDVVQEVRVSALKDNVYEGNHTVYVRTSAESDDPNYHEVLSEDVTTILIEEDELPQILAASTSQLANISYAVVVAENWTDYSEDYAAEEVLATIGSGAESVDAAASGIAQVLAGTTEYISVMGLKDGVEYIVYAVPANTNGYGTTASTTVKLRSAPPEILSPHPTLTNITQSSFAFTLVCDQNATASYMVVEADDQVPSDADILGGGDAGGGACAVGALNMSAGVAADVQVLALVEGRDYTLYIIPTNSFGQGATVNATVATKLPLPEFTPGYPNITLVNDTAFTVAVSSDQNATVAYAVVSADSRAPSDTEILDESAAGAVASGTVNATAELPVHISVEELQEGMAYTFYAIPSNDRGRGATANATATTSIWSSEEYTVVMGEGTNASLLLNETFRQVGLLEAPATSMFLVEAAALGAEADPRLVYPTSIEITPEQWHQRDTWRLAFRALDDLQYTAAQTKTDLAYVLVGNDTRLDGWVVAEVHIIVTQDESAPPPPPLALIVAAEGEELSISLPEGSSTSLEVGGLTTHPLHPVYLEEVVQGSGSRAALWLNYTSTASFDEAQYYAPVTVTLAAVEDVVQRQDAVIRLNYVSFSEDLAYDNTTALSVLVTVLDNDAAGIDVAPAALELAEGRTLTFEVNLRSQPAEDASVTVTVASTTNATHVAAGTPLRFTAADWDVAQPITLQGNEVPYDVTDVVTLQVSSDGDYFYDNLVAVPNVTVVVTNTVTRVSTTVTTDGGGVCVTPRWTAEVAPRAVTTDAALQCWGSYTEDFLVDVLDFVTPPSPADYVVEAYLVLVPASAELAAAPKRVCGAPLGDVAPANYTILGIATQGGAWAVESYEVSGSGDVCIAESTGTEVFALAQRRSPLQVKTSAQTQRVFSSARVYVDEGIRVEQPADQEEAHVTAARVFLEGCDPSQDRLSLDEGASDSGGCCEWLWVDDECTLYLRAVNTTTMLPAEVQAALRVVQFVNEDSAPSPGRRSAAIEVEVEYRATTSGALYYATVPADNLVPVEVVEPNRPPTIAVSRTPSSLLLLEKQTGALDAGLEVEDQDGDAIYGVDVSLPCYETDTLSLSELASGEGSNASGAANITARGNTSCTNSSVDPTLASSCAAPGVLVAAAGQCYTCLCSLQLTGPASAAAYQEALRRVMLQVPGPATTLHTRNAGFVARDPFSSSAAVVRTVVVSPVNDAPRLLQQSVLYAQEDGGCLPGALHAEDPEGQALWYSVVCAPDKGSLHLTGVNNGAYSYCPDPDANGDDSFVFQASDGALKSYVATVSISVSPTNDPPIAYNSSLTVMENVT